jgi:hypothetical protein
MGLEIFLREKPPLMRAREREREKERERERERKPWWGGGLSRKIDSTGVLDNHGHFLGSSFQFGTTCTDLGSEEMSLRVLPNVMCWC